LLVLASFRVQAFFYDVGRKFKLGQSYKVFCDLLKDFFIFVFVFKLENVLNEIISEGIFDQVLHVFDYVGGQLQFLRSSSLFQASLHDAAPVLVHANLNTEVHACFEYELSVLLVLLTS
jgi:hypothetical protein